MFRRFSNVMGREVLVSTMRSLSVDLQNCALIRKLHLSGSPVWLEGDFVVAGHLTQILLQLSEELLVTFCLVQGHKGVNVGELVPGDWLQGGERSVFVRFTMTILTLEPSGSRRAG